MRPRTNLGIGLGVRLAHKLVKSVMETSSKVAESKTYNKIINNPIYENK